MKGGEKMKVSDLKIDALASVGSGLLLTEVTPVYSYKNNQRTDEIIGYKYHVAMMDHSLEKIAVKIEGKKLMDIPEDGYVEVEFKGLELALYTMNGQPQVTARAAGITEVKGK